MKNTWNIKQWGLLLLCAATLSACSNTSTTPATAVASVEATAETANETESGGQLVSMDLSQKVEYDEEDAYTDWDSATATKIKLNGASASVEGSGAAVKDSEVTITAAGTYAVSGKLDNGQIIIDVPDKGVVRLILNGADIHSEDSAPIYVKEAGKTIISLQEGTDNMVSDGETYVYPDAEKSSDTSTDDDADEPNSAIFSKDDLTINGTGKLVVQGNYNNGITSKDELKVIGGTLEVHAVDDALMGRDLVAIQAGDVTIEAGGHGVKTTNDEADSLGLIAIAGGTLNIKSGEDSLHSNGGVQVAGGELSIAAGDDGIHADVALAISGGTIDITKSNEGIEAPTALISDGTIRVVSSDDGVNIAGGVDSSGEMEGPPGWNSASSSNKLTITGGSIVVDASGDGLDANGSIEMSGGTVIVNGPTENNNGALDYDGTFIVTGGTLVAAGSSGMVQAASEQSTQYGMLMTYPQTQSAGTILHLEDIEGNNVLTFSPSKAYQSVFVSSPSLKKDTSYTLYSGGTSTGSSETNGIYEGGDYKDGTKVVDFEVTTITTWLNESGVTEARNGFMGGPGGGGRGEGGGRMRPEGDMPPQGERPNRMQ